jgi:hypothetical protein
LWLLAPHDIGVFLHSWDRAADLSDDSGKPSNHPRHQKALSRRLSEGYYLTEQ